MDLDADRGLSQGQIKKTRASSTERRPTVNMLDRELANPEWDKANSTAQEKEQKLEELIAYMRERLKEGGNAKAK